MSNGGLTKVTAKTAAEVCKLFPLGDEAKKLLRDGMAPRPFLDVLIEKQEFADAVRFLAHALPKREAVWWACQCARQAYGANPPAPLGPALQAAEKWVIDPSEENRRAAHAASEAAGLGVPAGCAAMAAFFSGGSLGAADRAGGAAWRASHGPRRRGGRDAGRRADGTAESAREISQILRPGNRRRQRRQQVEMSGRAGSWGCLPHGSATCTSVR